MSWKVRSVHATLTYGGLLEGSYGFANKFMALGGTFKYTVDRMWGPRPTIFLNHQDYATREDKLPEWTYYAWLDELNFEPGGDDGRELVVVWFSDCAPDGAETDLGELMTDELWKAHSVGYEL